MTLNKTTYQFESDNAVIQPLLDLVYFIGINNILAIMLIITAIIIFYFASNNRKVGE